MPSRPKRPLSALAALTTLPAPAFAKVAQRFSAFLPSLILGLALCGCAGQAAFRNGKDLVEHDKVEEGLAQFQEAIRHEPRNVEYRSAYLQTRDRAIDTYMQRADRLFDAGKTAEAEKLYLRSLGIDQTNERARSGVNAIEMTRRHAQVIKDANAAWERKDAADAQTKLNTILMENPRHAEALALRRNIAEKTAKPPVESMLAAAYRKPITIEFKDVALKQVFEVIARTSGLNFLFDKDVKTDQKTSIFLKNSNIESAVHFTLLTNQLEQQILDANTILIYPNTPAKLKDYQEIVVKTFFLANAEAKTVANTIKTIVKTRDVVVDEKLNMLIVRDSPEAIRLAEKLIALHDVPEPEVMLEVEILEVKRTRLLNLGIQWPENLTLTALPSVVGGQLTLRDLLTNVNSNTLSAGTPSTTVQFKNTDSDTNLLANPRIRARNHEKAKILIGERVPNITVTSTSTGFASESINYVDVGLKLDVEPTVYLDGDVAIKISLEVSSIVSTLPTKSGTLAYTIGTRTASTVLRLKDGENQVLAGLINDQDRRSANKLPGLGDIPILGKLFGASNDSTEKTEIVLSITPHLIRNIQRPEPGLSEFRAGTDSSLRIRPDSTPFAQHGMPNSPPNPPPMFSPSMPQPPQPQGLQPNTPGRNSINAPIAPSSGLQGGNPDFSAAMPNADAQAATGGAQVSWTGPRQLRVGETFALQMGMSSDQPVMSLPMALGFDRHVLQVVGITEGDFLKQGGAQTNFSSRIDPNGQILMTGTRAGNGGATAAGEVATINFRALTANNASPINIITIAPIGMGGRAIAATLPGPHIVQVQP